ncbi:MAG: hypothetical protein ACXW2U_07210 [Telluria sp.]
MSDLYNTAAAAEFLHELLPGKTPTYWSGRLVNMRRSDRSKALAIPFSTAGKTVFYDENDIRLFADFERSCYLGKVKVTGRAAEALKAFGIGQAGGGAQGRAFKGATVNIQVSNDDGQPFVQTIVNEPLTVFVMTPDQAIEFGKELIEAGQAAKRITKDAK